MSTKITSVAVENSTIDSSTVGATTPGTGQFTSLTADSSLNACGELVVNTSSATLTTAPAATDSSSKVPTTGWVQGLFAAMGFAVSLGNPGYIKLPSFLGGLILQWGLVSSFDTGPATITWPLTYPTACLNAWICQDMDTTTTAREWMIGSLSTSGAQCRNDGTAGGRWFSVGY